jgi:CIC family chloride channel protein
MSPVKSSSSSGKGLRLRLWLRERLRPSELQANLLWAALVGVIGSLATVAFREGIQGVLWLLTQRSGSLVQTAKSLAWWERLLVPTLGGLIAGLLLQFGARFSGRSASSDYMEAISLGQGILGVRRTIVTSASSLFSVASGASIGREGSMVQLAAMLASWTGRLASFSSLRLRLLVACGAAAGITSAYNAPIAGALFVSEIVLGTIAMESFGPLIVSSVVANITIHQILGYRPTYEMPMFDFQVGWDVIFYVGLGFLAGAVAPQFLRLLDASKLAFSRVRLPVAAKLSLGGLLVGLLSVPVPEVWGNGYSVVNSILNTDWLWSALLALLAFKVLATAATAGSGAVGGVFTPTLFVGAALGCLFGQGVQNFLPAPTTIPSTYAAVGMGCFLAATTHAPLTSILMIFEMTMSYPIVLPLMLACVTAYYTARLFRADSVYSSSLRHGREENPAPVFEASSVRDLLIGNPPRVAELSTFEEMTRTFVKHRVNHVYVTGPVDRLIGVILLHDIAPFLSEGRQTGSLLANDFVHDCPTLLTPDMGLGDALQKFLSHHADRLPVINNADDRRLLGEVSKTDLLLLLHGEPQPS